MHRGLHYHKIVENEFYVSPRTHQTEHRTDGKLRATRTSGSPPCRQPLATAIPSAPSSCSSLRLHQVRGIQGLMENYTEPYRPSIRVSRPLVRPDPSAELVPSQVRRWRGHLSDFDLRRMDIRNLYR